MWRPAAGRRGGQRRHVLAAETPLVALNSASRCRHTLVPGGEIHGSIKYRLAGKRAPGTIHRSVVAWLCVDKAGWTPLSAMTSASRITAVCSRRDSTELRRGIREMNVGNWD